MGLGRKEKTTDAAIFQEDQYQGTFQFWTCKHGNILLMFSQHLWHLIQERAHLRSKDYDLEEDLSTLGLPKQNLQQTSTKTTGREGLAIESRQIRKTWESVESLHSTILIKRQTKDNIKFKAISEKLDCMLKQAPEFVRER